MKIHVKMAKFGDVAMLGPAIFLTGQRYRRLWPNKGLDAGRYRPGAIGGWPGRMLSRCLPRRRNLGAVRSGKEPGCNLLFAVPGLKIGYNVHNTHMEKYFM
jgi:hypothetical protein